MPGLVYAQLRSDFPKILPNPSLNVQSITIGQDGQPQPVNQELRQDQSLRFWRDDETGAITVGANRLGLSHYKPYSSWKSWKPIIEQAFDAYVTVADPAGVQRIGLRYINQIESLTDVVEPEDHFNFYAFVGETLPQDLITFKVDPIIKTARGLN